MEMSNLVAGITADLRRAGAVGDEHTQRVANLLVDSVEPSIRLRLFDALQEAAAELAASLPGAAVDVRLEGRNPVFSLVLESHEPSPGFGAGAGETEIPPSGADGELARLTLRLRETLKTEIERAADRAGMSVNAWLADAAARGLATLTANPPAQGRRGPRRMTGRIQG